MSSSRKKPAPRRTGKQRNAPAAKAPDPAVSSGSRESIFTMKMEEIERRLASGQVDAEMELYFGPQLAELQTLARSAEVASRSTRGNKPKALILPGIMGSTLGFRRPLLSMFHDTVWVDPLDAAMGRLELLGIPSSKKIIALDVFPIIYLSMKLGLAAEGFEVEYFPFDWRLNLKDLGKALKTKLDRMGGQKVHLAAHSMGGLVARAALKQGASNIGTVVMMGTPNHGSYAPVLAFRGSHDLAAKVSGLDLKNDNVELAEKVFSTFTGLAQMLPLGPISNNIDWHDPAIWPASPKVRPAVLAEADSVTSLLASPGRDWHLIAGINQETVAKAERDPGGSGLRYQKSFEGDGTVPLQSAVMPELDSRVYYVDQGHGTLPMNGKVRQAVLQLFRGEPVTVLSPSKPAIRPAPSDWVTDSQLMDRARAAAIRSTRRGADTVSQAAERLRKVLDAPLGSLQGDGFVSGGVPSPSCRPSVEPPKLRGYTVSRETQHYLEIELVHGDVSQVNAEAIVLCRFENMDLGRAAQAVDARMHGVLADLMQRRMFTSNVGEIFILPTGRHPVSADFVAVAGLGAMDAMLRTDGEISWDTLELVAENTLRTLLGAGVTEFATLLFSNLAKAETPVMREGLNRLLRGFVRGLKDSKDSRRFRRILLCEADRERYLRLRQCLLDLLPDPQFESVQVRLDESTLPPPESFGLRTMAAAGAGEMGRDPTYLFVRSEDEGATLNLEMTLSSAIQRAATPREKHSVSKKALQEVLDHLTPPPNGLVTAAMADKTGALLADLVLHPTLRLMLEMEKDNPIIIVHDAEASRIPWETLRFGSGDERIPACKPGISRQYAAANLSVAKWLESRREDRELRVLLIVDPTDDLPGAKVEGKRLHDLLHERPGVVLTELWQGDATRAAVLGHFRSGNYDMVHYAGHAFFDPAAPENSGLVCAPRHPTNPAVLSGADLAKLGQLPMLVFLNACESARVRGLPKGKIKKTQDKLPGFVGVAEALMRGGVANFIGTYWPVGDDAADTFSKSFYGNLLKGLPLGQVVTEARRAVLKDGGSGDWADYLHYGSPNFVLKNPEPQD